MDEVNGKRRALALLGLFAAACSGSGSDTSPSPSPVPAPPPPAPPPPITWNVQVPVLNVGQTFDLATTLPAGVKHGGTFSVTGLTDAKLSPAGILTGTVAGTNAGVIFQYVEP